MTSEHRGRVRCLLVVVITALALASPAAVAIASPAPKATPASAGTVRGDWDVRRLGTGRWLVSWTSPHRLPVHSDRPTIVSATGAPLGVSTTATDGRTVHTVVVSAARPSPARLGVVLSGSRLDRLAPAERNTAPGAITRSPAATGRTLDADPGVPGPYATVTSDYVRPAVKLAGMRQPIEMVGHVVEPASDAQTGPRPLVLFLHGRHDYCYQAGRGEPNDAWPCRGPMREVPSQLGYDYVQRLLASQGYTTVSVRVNGINAQDYELADGGASARAAIVARHLDYWATIAAQHQVDLTRVVLVGHSRGGEGVDRASIRIPLSAPYRIAGQVLVAPTDFANQTAPYVPTVTLLPYCDGDVSDLQGQRFIDSARDITGDDHSLKSSVLIMGANHNFFNTEWTPGVSKAPSVDDWPTDQPKALCGTKHPGRLNAAQQRAVGQAYIAGAVSVFTKPASVPSLLPMFDGSAVRVASAGKAVVYTHSLGGDRVVRRPSTDTSLALADGADSGFCTGSASIEFRPGVCGSELGDVTTPHWPALGEQPVYTHKFWQVGWTAAGQSAGLRFNRPLDLRSRDLDLRTIVDHRRGPAKLRLALTDAAGASATLTPDGGGGVVPLPTSPASGYYAPVAKLWAQTVRVDPRPAAGTVDLSRIVGVRIIGVSPRGQLWVNDLSSSAGTLPAPASDRLPTLSIGTRSVPEGNTGRTTVVGVPFRLSRPMDKPGRFRVATVGEQPGSSRLIDIDLAPGQQSGTIPVGFESDRLDSPARSVTAITAVGGANVVTDNYIGQLVVLDDDPTPKVTITRVRRTISEGMSAQWKVTLSKPVAYDPYIQGDVVLGPGRDLSGADVPSAWLRDHAGDTDVTKTLAALGAGTYADLRPGSRTVVLSIPVRRDGAKEPAEAVTLRVNALGKRSTSTVVVAASR